MRVTNARPPSETRPERMGPLARLPMFLSLEGKRAVLAGGSAATASTNLLGGIFVLRS